MAVSREVVLRLAEMTRIGVSSDEADRLTREMGKILEHIDKLREIDTSGLTTSDQALSTQDGTRPDKVTESLPVDDVLANAPERRDGFFVVPAVFGE